MQERHVLAPLALGLEAPERRGDEYICDLKITDVEVDTAAGVLELVQQGNMPRINDNVSTGL